MSNRNATVTVNTKANTGGIKSATNAIKNMDSGLKGTLGNLKQFKGALGALAVVGIAKGIKSFADDMRNAYMVQAKAEKSVNDALYSNMTARGESQQAIDGQVKAYKDLASQLQDVGVIGDEVTLSGMGLMTQMGLTTDQVKTMTPLLQDLAVKQFGLNVSTDQYKEVSQSVATMVNMGKLSLQKYGIQVTDVERKQFKSMSQSERFAFVMDKLKNSVAGANEAMAQTAGGKIQQMNNAIGDCEEQVGKLANTIYGGIAVMALPIVKNLTGSFQEFANVMSDNDQTEYKFLSEDQVNTLAGIRDGLKAIYNNLTDIFGSSSDFGTSFGLTDGLLGLINNIVAALKQATEWARDLNNAMKERTNGQATIPGVIGASVDTAMKFTPIGAAKALWGTMTGEANGTNYWQGGRTLVGEYGPELVDLPRGASIKTNSQTQRELSGGSGLTINVNMPISGNVIGNEQFANDVGDIISSRVSMAIANS